MNTANRKLKTMILAYLQRKVKVFKRPKTMREVITRNFCATVLQGLTKGKYKYYWELKIPAQSDPWIVSWIDIVNLMGRAETVGVFVKQLPFFMCKGDGKTNGNGKFYDYPGSIEVQETVKGVLEVVSRRL